MLDELLGELIERLEGLGVDRDEAEEILAEMRDRAYETGYDEGVSAGQDEGRDPEDEDPAECELWDAVNMEAE